MQYRIKDDVGYIILHERGTQERDKFEQALGQRLMKFADWQVKRIEPKKNTSPLD